MLITNQEAVRRLMAVLHVFQRDAAPTQVNMRRVSHPCGSPSCVIGYWKASPEATREDTYDNGYVSSWLGVTEARGLVATSGHTAHEAYGTHAREDITKDQVVTAFKAVIGKYAALPPQDRIQ